MSVLIKGMEMPENCIKCPMQFGGMCYVMPAEVDEGRVAPTVEEAWKQGKPDWCPLIEIPEPHGRLIDADKLLRDATRHVGCPPHYEPKFLARLDVEDAPTVIPREDGEKHDT